MIIAMDVEELQEACIAQRAAKDGATVVDQDLLDKLGYSQSVSSVNIVAASETSNATAAAAGRSPNEVLHLFPKAMDLLEGVMMDGGKDSKWLVLDAATASLLPLCWFWCFLF